MPTNGFDPSEVAIPWQLMTQAGIEVSFATANGNKASPDMRMLKGTDLGIVKSLLKARQDGVDACYLLLSDPSFCSPLSYDNIQASHFDGLLLPGGHDKSVKEYLESVVLQRVVVDFFAEKKPVSAICHGLIVAARSIDPQTNKSVLFDYKTTALLKIQELAGFNLTRLWLGDYYLTYPEITVEDEVKSVLSSPSNFIRGPLPLFRDTPEKLYRGFFVHDKNFLSARWPGGYL